MLSTISLKKKGNMHARLQASLLTQEVEVTLLLSLFEDVLLDGARSHQPVDVYLSRLPDAMCPVLPKKSQVFPKIWEAAGICFFGGGGQRRQMNGSPGSLELPAKNKRE